MTNRNDMLGRIEDLLGSEGDRELAEAMFTVLKQAGDLTFDPGQGYQLADDIEDQIWLARLAQAEKLIRNEVQ